MENNYLNLNNYRNNVFSQNGEDGILEELLKRLRISNKNSWCVEFGAWDGKYLSNTYNLVRNGWHGIYIEGDTNKFKDLLITKKEHKNIIAINKFVSKNQNSDDSLDKILQKTNIPINFEILSIDIDSYDLEVWDSIICYRPKIVIIEINSSYPPGIIKWHSEKNSNVNGNSFSATLAVGKEKGYEFIFHSGNMIFVREELVGMLCIDPKYLIHPELLFDDYWYSIEKNMVKKSLLRVKAFLNEKIKNQIKNKINKLISFKKIF